MISGLRQLCVIALFCGALLSLMPSGGVRRVAEIGCTAIMILILAKTFSCFDTELLRIDLARYHERSEELITQSGQLRDRLDRSVIEKEYAAYILDEAAILNIFVKDAAVTARWDLNGLWLPFEVRINGTADPTAQERLTQRITAEFGVAAERVIWNDGA